MSTEHPTDFAAQLELAWAAGFFDGEGCTHLHGDKKADPPVLYLHITIGQVERCNLERFQAAVGAGSINGPRVRPFPARPAYYLVISSHQAKKVLDLLWPYLGEVKKRQAEEVMRTGKIGRGFIADRGQCVHGHLYTPDNVYHIKGGRIRCKTCADAAERAYKARKKAEAKRLKAESQNG